MVRDRQEMHHVIQHLFTLEALGYIMAPAGKNKASVPVLLKNDAY